MQRGQGRSHRGDDVAHAVLVRHQYIRVSFDDRQAPRRLARQPSLIQSVNQIAFLE